MTKHTKPKADGRLSFIVFFIIAIPLVVFLYDPALFSSLSDQAQTGIENVRDRIEIPAKYGEKSEMLSETELATKLTYTSIESALQATKPRKLNLAGRNLRYVPTDLRQLKYLQTLGLEKNQITELVLPADSLLMLQYLNVSLNKIKHLPIEIGKLENLKRLEATGNLLKTVPLEIVKLKKLQTLSLRYNQLEQIPKHLCDLPALDSLFLGFNQLLRLPKALTALNELTFLDLEYNKDLDIGHFVEDFKHFKQLKTLKVAGIKMSEADKKRLKEALPQTQVEF